MRNLPRSKKISHTKVSQLRQLTKKKRKKKRKSQKRRNHQKMMTKRQSLKNPRKRKQIRKIKKKLMTKKIRMSLNKQMRNHQKMIILYPHSFNLIELMMNFYYLFCNYLIYMKILLPVLNLILPNVFNVFKVMKQGTKNCLIVNQEWFDLS